MLPGQLLLPGHLLCGQKVTVDGTVSCCWKSYMAGTAAVLSGQLIHIVTSGNLKAT